MSGREFVQVTDDERNCYGREDWFRHQEKDLSFPNIKIRARTDLAERCLPWLRSVLKYRLPPEQVLELGNADGGFVALLHWAGFDATGLELSPWVVQFARKTFGMRMLLGPVEDQQIKRYLYLFSQRSISGDLIGRLGTEQVVLEPAQFPYSDMFLVVNRAPLAVHRPAKVERALSATPDGRMVQALLGLGGGLDDLKQRYAESEQGRAMRLEAIEARGGSWARWGRSGPTCGRRSRCNWSKSKC